MGLTGGKSGGKNALAAKPNLLNALQVQTSSYGQVIPVLYGQNRIDPTRFYIAQTRDAQQAIEKARQAQIACVEAFEGYAVAKVGKDPTVSLTAKQTAVAGYLAQLPALLNAVRALIGVTPPSSAGLLTSDHVGFATSRDGRMSPRVSIARLRAASTTLRSPDHSDHRITGSGLEVSLGQ